MNNNGQSGFRMIIALTLAMFIFIAISLGLVLFSAVLTQGFGTVTNTLTSINSPSNNTNISYYSSVSFGNVNSAFSQLRWWSLVIIFGMMLGLFLAGTVIRPSPFLFGFWILLSAPTIMVSIFISRTYESLYNSGGSLANQLHTFTATSYILLYLPVWITTIAFIGAVLIFIRLKTVEKENIF